jgi:low affinity Fe/Cu permease
VSERLSERQRTVGVAAARATRPEAQSRAGKQHHHFSDIARKASTALGSAWAFLAACALVVLWMMTGPLFGFSDAWQLVINTGTTIVTFLMVFLIQNTQNRDSRALHLKLDELIRSTQAARNQLIDLENCTDEELERVEQEFATAKDRRRSAAGTVQHKQ